MWKSIGQKALNERFRDVARLPPARCRKCGKYDNDWKERNGLCCKCFCHEFVRLKDSGLTNEQALNRLMPEDCRIPEGMETRRTQQMRERWTRKLADLNAKRRITEDKK